MATAMTCAESEELLALAALGALSRADAEPLEGHLRLCEVCRRTAAEYRNTVSRLPAGLPEAEPPATLRRNLMRAAYGEAAPRPRSDRWERLRAALPRRRLLTLAGAGATAAAVVVAVVVLTRPAAPGPLSYSVMGTTSAPSVRGTLTYYADQQQAVLTVTGLPPVQSTNGASPPVYEVWLIPSGGVPQGAAFLTQSPTNQSWSTVIHTDLTRYSAVAATQEPAGGSTGPTGAELLSVQVTR